MTLADRLTVIAAAIPLVAWLYWLTIRAQKLMNHAESVVDSGDRVVWALQRRAAATGMLTWLIEPSEPPRQEPGARRAFGRLRLQEQLRAAGSRQEPHAPGPVPTPRDPAPGPSTVPMEQAWDTPTARDTLPALELVGPAPADVDQALARFSFIEGRTGHRYRDDDS